MTSTVGIINDKKFIIFTYSFPLRKSVLPQQWIVFVLLYRLKFVFTAVERSAALLRQHITTSRFPSQWIVKQLVGYPQFSDIIVMIAGLRWEKLPYIINKLNNFGRCDEKLKTLSYQERCNLLNNNPVIVARHFQYKVEVYFQRNYTWGSFWGKQEYAILIESQDRDSPNVYSFIWIFNAPKIENEAAHIEFTEKRNWTVSRPSKWSTAFWDS